MIKTKNSLKLLLILGVTLLAILMLGNTVNAATTDEYKFCTFRIVTIDEEQPTAMGQGDSSYQELIYETNAITKNYYFQLNTEINLGKTITLQGLGNFTLSRTYIGNNDETYYEYKSEVKDFNKIESKKQTLEYDLKDIDTNKVQHFKLDLSFMSNADKKNIENIIKDLPNKDNRFSNVRYDEANNNISVKFISYDGYVDYKKIVENIINDNAITLEYLGGSGGGGDLLFTSGGEGAYYVKKDGITYFTLNITNIYRTQIIVPNNVEDTDTAYIKYATSKMNEMIKQERPGVAEEEIEKIDTIEKINGCYYRYIFKGQIEDYEDQIIIIKKADGTPVGNNIYINNLTEGISVKATVKSNTTMETELKNKGYSNIIGAYELKLEGATKLTNPIDITFNVGTENNSKTVYILHQKQDGSYENFEKKVVDGKVTITVNELSPFVLALKEETTPSTPNQEKPTTKPTTKPEHVLDETPKTGNNNIMPFISLVIVTSIVGIIVLKKYSK